MCIYCVMVCAHKCMCLYFCPCMYMHVYTYASEDQRSTSDAIAQDNPPCLWVGPSHRDLVLTLYNTLVVEFQRSSCSCFPNTWIASLDMDTTMSNVVVRHWNSVFLLIRQLSTYNISNLSISSDWDVHFSFYFWELYICIHWIVNTFTSYNLPSPSSDLFQFSN